MGGKYMMYENVGYTSHKPPVLFGQSSVEDLATISVQFYFREFVIANVRCLGWWTKSKN
jgi:hypothetical protein